jgi:hypothetical protein
MAIIVCDHFSSFLLLLLMPPGLLLLPHPRHKKSGTLLKTRVRMICCVAIQSIVAAEEEYCIREIFDMFIYAQTTSHDFKASQLSAQNHFQFDDRTIKLLLILKKKNYFIYCTLH